MKARENDHNSQFAKKALENPNVSSKLNKNTTVNGHLARAEEKYPLASKQTDTEQKVDTENTLKTKEDKH